MVIKRGKSPKTAKIDNQNLHASTTGRQMWTEAKALQADVQGGVSDIVRKYDKIYAEGEMGDAADPTAEIAAHLDGLADQAPRSPDKRTPATADTYAMVQGRLVRIRKGIR